MNTIFLMGGLGNQLFQIFFCISYCLKDNTPYVFKYSEKLSIGTSERKTYWDTLLHKLRDKTYSNIEYNYFTVYKEDGFHYQEVKPYLQNVLFYGYFQSYKYFDHYKTQIFDLLSIRELQNEFITNTYSSFFVPDKKTVSIHFRLGDYKNIQDFHPLLPYEYYKKALELIPKDSETKYRVLYFCESQDNSIVSYMVNRLKQDFPQINDFFKVDDTIDDWKQMVIMSCCDINVIANSTFSWWGAYLKRNNNSIVLYPSIWFGPKLQHHNLQDLFPQNWIKIVL